ncbi:GNAT family N-acetyltransferase [Nocardia sp. NPDC049149]|uniref:GNAT family N-acetyltransferase n=1 Tax=Nocardia sp. NPDC049149 TaxID=3364315 RepID=UPI003716BA5F
MPSEIDPTWPTSADLRLQAGTHRLLHDVTELGGAIGFLSPPTRADTDAWLDGVLAAVRAGDAALAVAMADNHIAAMGLWRRQPGAVFAHSATIERVMAHPTARGLGLGRVIVTALIDNARDTGLETLTLGVRGNNHGAIELYEQLGFREWGRLPNVIEVGNDRYDDIRMYLELPRHPTVTLRGSQPGGPGWSPRRQAQEPA